jgi:hypothetical protein
MSPRKSNEGGKKAGRGKKGPDQQQDDPEDHQPSDGEQSKEAATTEESEKIRKKIKELNDSIAVIEKSKSKHWDHEVSESSGIRTSR